MNEKLKSCPRCGNTDLDFMRIQEVDGRNWDMISCKSCGQVVAWSTSLLYITEPMKQCANGATR